MSKFVFRNNTIERFLGKDYQFSGYDDISLIPQEAEGYVWWYQVPIKFEQDVLAEEIRGYAQKFSFVLQQIDAKKTFVALTMDIIYAVPFTDDDYQLQQAVDEYNSAMYDAERAYPNVKVIDVREFYRAYSGEERSAPPGDRKRCDPEYDLLRSVRDREDHGSQHHRRKDEPHSPQTERYNGRDRRYQGDHCGAGYHAHIKGRAALSRRDTVFQ